MNERINPDYRSEKVNGIKLCCVCGCMPRSYQDHYTVGNPENEDVVCGDSCMDRYYEDAIDFNDYKKQQKHLNTKGG